MTEEMEDPPPLCTKEASAIQAIDKKSVHRICSGQVVLTLATAVKELVENSIDAGATSVEIKLKDYGGESIEVIDNGYGIEEKNFAGVTLKHHTSKLQEFEDLINISTFGFRGEALSSLCALSNMSLVTRHKSVSVGTRLEFDANGKITLKKNTPRQVGTTLIVQNIFHTLPVRHKEFQRNLKKEFARLVQVLNAYCIINTGVRISCMNQTSKGSRTTVVSTNGNATMRENITNIFGPKQLLSLLEFQQVEAKEEVCSEFGIKLQAQSSLDFRIEGFVSKCEHGQGRSASDRQFLFINKRPCDATKIFKIINEVYHSYNRHQNPFISLHIQLKQECVDVNVTPDKRQIFVDGEKVLLAVLKASLIEMFEPTTSVYKINNTFSPSNTLTFSQCTPSPCAVSEGTPATCPPFSRSNGSAMSGVSLSNSLSNLKRSFSSAFDKSKDSPSSPVSLKNTKKSKTFPSSFSSPSLRDSQEQPDINANSMLKFVSSFPKKLSNSEFDTNENQKDNSFTPHSFSDTHETGSFSKDNKSICAGSSIGTHEILVISEVDSIDSNSSQKVLSSNNSLEVTEPIGDDMISGSEKQIEPEAEHCSERKDNNVDVNFTHFEVVEEEKTDDLTISKSDSSFDDADTDDQHGNGDEHYEGNSVDIVDEKRQAFNEECGGKVQLTDRDLVDYSEEPDRKEVIVKFSMDNLKNRLQQTSVSSSSASSTFSRNFRAKICPGDNSSAEEELSREISKDMFSKMKILGQFNLGFIITQLGYDLFIVDQHATDEKYNFEMLQKNTVLQSQRLIAPQSLELTASNETILVDNLEIFKKNGFDFLVEPDAPPTQRVKLISAPVSKNWNFGKDDIEELLFMLTDSPDVMCRPSRVRMMFASRACRKSIMIGTALNQSEMRKVVSHMGEIEQPWNCPHGRPTMRHLFDLRMLPSS